MRGAPVAGSNAWDAGEHGCHAPACTAARRPAVGFVFQKRVGRIVIGAIRLRPKKARAHCARARRGRVHAQVVGVCCTSEKGGLAYPAVIGRCGTGGHASEAPPGAARGVRDKRTARPLLRHVIISSRRMMTWRHGHVRTRPRTRSDTTDKVTEVPPKRAPLSVGDAPQRPYALSTMGDHTDPTTTTPRSSVRVLRETVAAEARAAGFEIPPNATWYDASTPRYQSASGTEHLRLH